jgi:putative Mg2+ transporter-C (MgtC) family protein
VVIKKRPKRSVAWLPRWCAKPLMQPTSAATNSSETAKGDHGFGIRDNPVWMPETKSAASQAARAAGFSLQLSALSEASSFRSDYIHLVGTSGRQPVNVLSNQDVIIRLLTAAILGSIIGFERERLLWAAGIRTHMVVCVGACLIMIVSAFGFGDSLTSKNVVLDPSRVAAQVVSGIGFLGAGAILARGEIVRGLTTAASIWTVAAIGLAVGGGLYFAAAVSTVVIIVILAGIKPLEEAYRARNQSCRLKIEATNASLTPELLKQTLGIRTGQIKRFLASPNGANDEIVVLLSKVSSHDIKSFVEKINELDGVSSVRLLLARVTANLPDNEVTYLRRRSTGGGGGGGPKSRAQIVPLSNWTVMPSGE